MSRFVRYVNQAFLSFRLASSGGVVKIWFVDPIGFQILALLREYDASLHDHDERDGSRADLFTRLPPCKLPPPTPLEVTLT